jgi:hypothetical protein
MVLNIKVIALIKKTVQVIMNILISQIYFGFIRREFDIEPSGV